MQLPDEAISYQYHSLLIPPGEEWTPTAELRSKNFLHPNRLKDSVKRLELAKSQVVAERESRNAPPEALPLDAGFIDLPQTLLDGLRRKGDMSDLGKIIATATRLREHADNIVVLGAGGDGLAGRVLFDALKSTYHNELPSETRMGVPRMFFDGDSFDNDALQELRDLLEISCVDPGVREERWGVVIINRSGTNIETQAALRVFRRDATEYYGIRSDWIRFLFTPVTGSSGPMADLFRAEGYTDEEILFLPENVGSRFGVFSAAGLLPAALMGLDVRALLMGAAAMTRRFLDEPFDKNPVLQLAAVNHLMYEEVGKSMRVLSIWSKKLASLGHWYDQLVATSLGKMGRGPTPVSMVQTRDLYGRGQQQQEGPRDRFITNLVVRAPHAVPIAVQMADRNEDNLNQYARKTLPDLMSATLQGANRAYAEVARPTADLIVPTLSEHTMGQLLQLLMLATVVEGRLMGVNPYSEQGIEPARRGALQALKG